MKLIRKFKCDLTGDNCVIVEKKGEEICLLEEEMLTGEKSPVERLEDTIAVLWNQYKQAKSQREYESIVNRINYLSGKLEELTGSIPQYK